SRRPPIPPLFPYTTLFRSRTAEERGYPAPRDERFSNPCRRGRRTLPCLCHRVAPPEYCSHCPPTPVGQTGSRTAGPRSVPVFERSEEHTSELQSRFDLVCR